MGEVDSYALVQPRYGALRDGTALLVFVTEEMSQTLRVKADPGKHPASDLFPVLKLNAIRTFQTGIYDYKVMTSTFARTESTPAFRVEKVSFSSTEWCGQLFQEWIAGDKELRGIAHSYFDGEADAQLALDLPADGVMEDALPILLRGLRGDWLPAGASRVVPYLPSSLRARLGHTRQKWGEATITRGAAPGPVATRALGKLLAIHYVVAEKGGVATTWTIEAAAPHRLLAWSASDGDAGKLIGSKRIAYWRFNHPGDERELGPLGLSPLSGPVTAPPAR